MSEEANSMSQMISFFRLGAQDSSSSFTQKTGVVPASQAATSQASEPLMTYQPSTSSSAPEPTGQSEGGAASFSSDDGWERF